MPKRKHSASVEHDLQSILSKVKKLERKIRKQEKTDESSESSDSILLDELAATLLPGDQDLILRPEDWLPVDNEVEVHTEYIAETADPGVVVDEPAVNTQSETPANNTDSPIVQTEPHVVAQDGPCPSEIPTNEVINLDNDLLEILGEDPLSTTKYGKDLRPELATRLQHIATEGLSKENRKALVEKYLLPANCLRVGAPKINPEVQAAILPPVAKRDKGIELKQSQMASAISCLADVINMQMNSTNRNNEVLQKIMDAARLLCDLQHWDSVTRRNCLYYGLKKDIKDHLNNTKIDTLLFGENLADTLRSAKAVTKSGLELKFDLNKNHRKSPKTGQKSLNRSAAPAMRRQPGPSTANRARNRYSQAWTPAPAPPQHARSSRQSYNPQPPPPPPPTTSRYRH